MIFFQSHTVGGDSVFVQKWGGNVLWQEDKSSNGLRAENLTLITEDSSHEGRGRAWETRSQPRKKRLQCLTCQIAPFSEDKTEAFSCTLDICDAVIQIKASY